MDVRKLGCSLLEQDYGAAKSQATLKESKLVNHVLARVFSQIGVIILSSHDQKGKGAAPQHTVDDVANCMSSARADFVCLDGITVLLV